MPQFSPLPNPAGHYQNLTVPPPGVAGGAAPVPMPQMQPMMSYQVPSNNPALRHYAPMPNGYAPPPQGTINPTGGSSIQLRLITLFLCVRVCMDLNLCFFVDC